MSATDECLLMAVIKQAGDIKLDYELLAQDIGAPTKGAAAKRWSRYLVKLKAGNPAPTNSSPAKPAGVTKSKATPSKAASAKKAAAAKGKKGAANAEDEVDGEHGAEADEEEEGIEPVTPVKKKKAAPKAKAAPKTKKAAHGKVQAGKARGKAIKSEERISDGEPELLEVESDNEEMTNGGPVNPMATESASGADAGDEDAACDGYYAEEDEEA